MTTCSRACVRACVRARASAGFVRQRGSGRTGNGGAAHLALAPLAAAHERPYIVIVAGLDAELLEVLADGALDLRELDEEHRARGGHVQVREEERVVWDVVAAEVQRVRCAAGARRSVWVRGGRREVGWGGVRWHAPIDWSDVMSVPVCRCAGVGGALE